MIKIKCTKKLLNEVGQFSTPNDSLHAPVVLGDWHANLFYIQHKKCILFTNDRTLFSIVIFNKKRQELIDFQQLFVETLLFIIYLEGFGVDTIETIRNECKNVIITKTDSRSVLGSMNDRLLELSCILQGGVTYEELHKKLNRTIVLNRDFHRPIDGIRKLLAQHFD